jgi:excisionase family DNA binding protein
MINNTDLCSGKPHHSAGRGLEKLLLTVWEAADVLSVSRSRVYERLYAEQLDSVKIGRSRRVAPASVRRLADGPSAS